MEADAEQVAETLQRPSGSPALETMMEEDEDVLSPRTGTNARDTPTPTGSNRAPEPSPVSGRASLKPV
jgi:hypothetical protein